jgi:hypothetical protein
MSVVLLPSEDGTSFVLRIDPPASKSTVARQNRAALFRHLGVIGEMLTTMDTLTAPGQHHTMRKLVAVIEEQIGQLCRDQEGPHQHLLRELLEHLTRESQRSWPDVRSFSHRAKDLLDVLVAVAQVA